MTSPEKNPGVVVGGQFVPKPHHQNGKHLVEFVKTVDRRKCPVPQAFDHFERFDVPGAGNGAQETRPDLVVRDRAMMACQHLANGLLAGEPGFGLGH